RGEGYFAFYRLRSRNHRSASRAPAWERDTTCKRNISFENHLEFLFDSLTIKKRQTIIAHRGGLHRRCILSE
ncbi:hypothetical protein M5D96_012326, partial [Drosophila gunungcola]